MHKFYIAKRGYKEILTENELLSAVENKTFIEDGREESWEGIKYDFTLRKMVLTPELGRPRDIKQSQESAVIKPCEIAFVMTGETLNLPGNIYCQLSTKRKISLDGKVILGGLIIDPDYKGKLIFGLYNLSPRNYPLLSGKKLVTGVLYRLDKIFDKIPEPINNFPDDLIRAIVDTKSNSISAINNVLEELKAEMQSIKTQLTHDDQ
jgi:dUTPase